MLCTITLLISCGREQHTKGNSQPSLEEQIIGKWKNQEVSNGVEYFITFHHNHTISQVFVDANGRARLYDGTWQISADSLTIQDRGNTYQMVITEMMDSTMVMVRTDSMAVVFDRYADPEGFLPDP